MDFKQTPSGIFLPSNCFYFLGVDPAPAKGAKSDDGALVTLRARPRPGITEPTANPSDWLCEYVWAYVLRNATCRQWSAFIHFKHQHFGFSGICMDPGGMGNQINDELILTKQFINGVERTVIPIASHMDLERTGPNVQLILTIFRPNDPGIDHLWPHAKYGDTLNEAMHIVMQEAISYMVVSWPKPYNQRPRSETESWPDEKKWALKTLDTARNQLIDIQVATNGDGTFALTGHGAKQFSAAGKKDLAYACIYAYVRFLVWLKMGELEFADGDSEQPGYFVVS